MTRSSRWIPVAFAVATLSTACGPDDSGSAVIVDPPPPNDGFSTTLQGSWVSCQAGYLGDVAETMTFSGEGFSGLDTRHASYDGTCAGSVVESMSFGGTFTVGRAVSAALGATTVTAHHADLRFTNPVSATLYTLLFVDADVTPDVLYIGDMSGAHGGTSPETRPVALEPLLPYRKR